MCRLDCPGVHRCVDKIVLVSTGVNRCVDKIVLVSTGVNRCVDKIVLVSTGVRHSVQVEWQSDIPSLHPHA